MPFCSVEGCTNKSGHLFPKNNPTLKKKWLNFVGLKEKDINNYSLICKLHFAEDAFDEHDPIPGLPPPRKRLIHNAVPTLFPNLLHDQPTITPRKKPVHSEVAFKSPASTSSANSISLAEVDLTRARVFSEEQLVKVIGRIKCKLKNNAHPAAVFPLKWKRNSQSVDSLKIKSGIPPFSMPCLVAMAVEANVANMANPSQIVGFISQNVPSYKLTDRSWHGKVFETLETYRLFRRAPTCISNNPKNIFYTFAPNRQTVVSPEVYEAFTDPFFDESKIKDPSYSDLSEDLEKSRTGESKEHSGLYNSKNVVATVSAPFIGVKRKIDSTDSNKRVRFSTVDDKNGDTTDAPDSELDSDSSADSSVTFLECSYCEFIATSTKTISSHVDQKHLNGKNYCCSLCSYVTPVQENLMSHKAKHKKAKVSNFPLL